MMPVANITAAPQLFRHPSMESDDVQRIDQWQTWAMQAPGNGEYRDIAVQRLKECLTHGTVTLDLSDLQLTSLPEFMPDFLQHIDISHNNFVHFPANLPDAVKELRIGHNLLTALADRLPASLNRLYANHNRLTTLPENLPASLALLDISHNQVATLPDWLPVSLVTLCAHHNQLRCLPANMPDAITTLNAMHNMLTHLPERLPFELDVLCVSHNRLTDLPALLPVSLKILDTSHNQLTNLPSRLPAALKILYASHNQLTILPDNLPITLEILDISCNQLGQLPGMLPNSLTTLFANYNRLTTLPENLPVFLQILDVSHNQLRRLPATLPNSLSIFSSNHNPQLDPADTLLDRLISRQALDRWYSSLPGFLAKITCWNNDLDTRLWETIYTEDNAAIFGEFLFKLYQGKNKTNSPLYHRVVNWLTYLAQADHQELRKNTFLLAREAAENCVDRASFYFNYMHILMVEHQLLSSDAPLMQIVQTIQGTFRLQVLERIAAEKAAMRRRDCAGFNEDLEVYVAYQSALQVSLALPIYTEPQFDQIADLTDEDLHQARATVANAEKTDFVRYWLTESTLWTAKLTRWDPERKAVVDSKYLDEIASTDFNEAVKKTLNDKGVSVDDSDAHRNVSQALAAELFYQYRYQLTREYLAAHQSLSLLDDFSMISSSLSPDVALH